MGLKYYLNLFKKDSNNEAVKLRYFLNVFVFLVFVVLSTVFFSLRNTNIIVSSVFGALAFLAIIFYRILFVSFTRLINRLINDEALKEQDETDAAFIAYRQGFAKENEKDKRLNRILFPLNITTAAIFIGYLPVTIILNLTGNMALADKIYTIVSIAAFVFLLGIFVANIFLTRKGVWYQNYLSELAIINNYKAASSDSNIKLRLTEDKKQNIQMEYMLPDLILRKRFIKSKKLFLACFFTSIIAFFISFIILLVDIAKNEKSDLTIIAILFGIFTILLIADGVFLSIYQKRTIKKQYRELKKNEAANSLYIKLHELRTPFMKRWNVLFPLCLIGSIVSNILLASVVSEIIKTGSYGWIFFLLFIVEFVATFVIYFKSYGKVRLKMIAIENQIDRIKTAKAKESENTMIS